LSKTFEEVKGYNDWVTLDSIRVESYCEHHLAPIIGVAKVGYLPNGLVVGISKLVRVVNAYSKRLQIQERLTREIALAIQETLNPKAVAVAIKAEHHCMCTRGVNKPGTKMLTSSFIGEAEKNLEFRRSFLEMD
jgi:GTP cyclohydrolase I